MWPHNKDGLYSVKSGYNILLHWKTTNAPSSAHSDPYNKVWKKLWCLPTIPRHIVLLWRILQRAIPVRSELNKRGIHCHILCPRCLHNEETINHAFMECNHAAKIWFGSKLRTRFEGYQRDFTDWLAHIITHLNEEDISYVASIVYGIWYARNPQINCDANLAKEGCWGLGAAFRDSEGALVAEATWEMAGYGDPILAEARATYQAIQMVVDCCFHEIVI
ncbi:hypothetical protein TSUD_188530 [Trifolium subterraneum]|uniref:Reverse transcriptase zinc-binding domain-containing protein n=1 Tax=Trifolium subterraneum TaxID=3900 RepID=A0A2Z6P1D9_TRISU|nr:hypothetical protein TSUD_188530 [Trifolium subterraneum]